MKLIDNSAIYIPQGESLEGIYRQIELCGRVCYRSENKITKDSAKGFVDRMIKSKHFAMLEAGTVYLERFVDINDDDYLSFESRYLNNPYSKVVYDGAKCYVTTNFRVITENLWLTDVQYADKPSFHEKRYTFRLVCSRAVAQELTRHRVFSFAMESQRYCGYDKGKFGNEITFIMPQWYKDTKYDSYKLNEFDKYLKQTEDLYMFYRECGMQPQEARAILPNCTKTELCMTGFKSDWKHFFDLRYFETTGKVDPEMKDLSTKMYELFQM